MPVISNPQYNPTSAYQPVVYEVFYTASPDVVKYCEFTVYVNGTAIATGRKEYYRTSPVFGSVEYYFKIDIQQYLQRALAPNRTQTTVFGTLNEASQIDNTDCYAEVYVEFRYLILSATTGKISEAPSFDTSDLRTVDIATRQNEDSRSFEEFLWIPTVQAGRFLTNAPTTQNICEDGNAFLSFMSDWNWMRLQCYDAGGVQLSDSYALTGNTMQIGHTTVGTGIQQLQDIAWFNSVNPVFTNCAYYVLSFGYGFVMSPTVVAFLPNTLQKRYNIEDCCQRKLRLHWLNSLGGVDSYAFGFTERRKTVTGTVFEKPLGWADGTEPPHSQADFGKALTNIQAGRTYQVRANVVSTEMEWLRDLYHSAEVYIENPDSSGNYWRVYVIPGTFTETKRGIVEMEFELQISQDIVTHRV